MPSAMLATALADPAYAAALAKVGDKGFGRDDTVTYGGKTYTHDEIAAICDESYQRHRGEYCELMGGKPRLQRKRQRQFRKAYQNDVYTCFGISWWTILFAGIMFLLAGPLGLVIAICAAIFEYYLTKDLFGDQAMLAAMGAA